MFPGTSHFILLPFIATHRCCRLLQTEGLSQLCALYVVSAIFTTALCTFLSLFHLVLMVLFQISRLLLYLYVIIIPMLYQCISGSITNNTHKEERMCLKNIVYILNAPSSNSFPSLQASLRHCNTSGL